MKNVLFLCTGNSARSIMAEGLLRHWGEGVFEAHSAGSQPIETLHPFALDTLRTHGVSTDGLRSKSWDEFGYAGAPEMDLVVTVCDAAANEACPILPGTPERLHWGMPDPAAALGGDPAMKEAFQIVYEKLEQRIARLVTIPFADRDADSVRADLEAIAAAPI